MQRFRVWDLPTRIFHWTLAFCVVGSFVTAKIGGNAMVWHGRIGVTVVGLLVFRLVWGFSGSTYARFSQFVRGPSAIRAYLRGQWQGAGHNPLGALSVLAMLATLMLLVATGLFANDDIAFEGPLYALVGKEFSDRLVGLHRLIEPAIILLVLAHLGAIFYYVRVKKESLVRPMVTGWRVGAGETAKGGGAIAFCVALVIALAAAYGASGAWLPEEPTAPPAAAGSAPAF
ncbi:cytochrome b/b6 domain-containing protein [Sulfuritalea hydrogenivorans]|uniref:Cytochrome B561 n=1 Tax=Sulfuritalea hydrogenivorans sk43H TaxID=1223802 RepID=W0SI57_9PROT|nr:cytochrome b/b6 domain-containing protein [Sulfuritalea hydrogenivorans]MDK9714115.1 cytochrome b/b6 domain-containing protein [Sulfuritalea sp.]BAO30497.1 cytochrome B561 [Sulfuritalea hydrogenivorans sk43H]